MKISERLRPYAFLVPLALGTFVLFFRLGTRPFLDYDEASFAEVVRETLKAHQFLSFQFIGAPWFHKPPLFFWLAMGATKVFPTVEFAMRSVSAFFGVALVMLTYALALLETESVAVALASSLMLLSMGGFVDLGRQVKTDLPVIFCIVFSYYSYLRAVRLSEKSDSDTNINKNKSWKWFLLLGVGIGAGVLFKSVIGFLAFPLIVLHSFFSKKWGWLKDKFFWLGMVLAGLIIAPWHIYETFIYGDTFWNNYLFGQVVNRLTSNLFTTHLSLLQLLWLAILNTAPWLLVFVVSLFFLKKNLGQWRVPLLVYSSYIFFIFIIFSVSKTRVDYYLTPSYPFIALFVSYFGYVVWKKIKTATARRIFLGTLIVFFVVSFAGMIAVGYNLLPQLTYERYLAEDEKPIGLLLHNIPQTETVYFADPNYWESVRFYSQGKTLALYVSGQEPPGSLVVVMSGLLASNTTFKAGQYQVIYKGEYVSLIRI
jgi:4-amino-4-deoxy-L-arabinose transferase-like glycosyltransferase